MISNRDAEEILKHEYHLDNFTYLVKELLLPDFTNSKHVVHFNNDIFQSVTQIGESSICNLSVFEVYLNEGTQNKRVAITQEMFKILRGLRIDNALVSFVNQDKNNYRISLLTSKYEYDGDKIVRILSNPRRFSYSLGFGTKTKTPYKYLIAKGKVNSLEELTERFSVEVVNKQFYNEIALCYSKLVGGERDGKKYERQLGLYSVVDQKKYAEFAVRLIGRLTFCWFLREKKSKNGIPLIPDKYLTIDEINHQDNYYHKVLEPLFFELLNTNQKKRKDKYTSDEFKQIPYLNGGLFSPHADDLYKYDNFTQYGKYGLVNIPNGWFVDFYNILSQYNFTVDENTSYDIELSIDPEMLGRIFENLLAEINPETGENAKKSTGSFYTPRDIVDYMVDSSLLEYLKTKTSIEETRLKALISYGKEDDNLAIFDEKEKKSIINALYTITILDPACGSGAFPIGMLQKIVYILQEVDPSADMWFDKATENFNDIFLKKEFEKKFKSGDLDYIRKLKVIQNSIFGIDIQPIAVEISRLRCFLSLIIEESVDDEEENRGVNPLPNLDFKFIIANSLIGLEDTTQMSLFENEDHIKHLKDVRDEYFNSESDRRTELKLEFKDIQQDMLLNTIANYQKQATMRYQQLSAWKPFDNEATNWFDSDWMFGIKEGFDIVIGNPPYIDSENMINQGMKSLREYISKTYTCAKGNWDMYIAFFEKGLDLLSKNGCLIFISPDKWISKPFGYNLRKKYLNNIKSIVFAGRDVFESALVDSIITMFVKYDVAQIKTFKMENKHFSKDILVKKTLISEPYTLDILQSTSTLYLVEKIENDTIRLDDLNIKCESACATSDCYKLKEILYSLSNAQEYDIKKHYKVVNTGTLGIFKDKWGLQPMKYLKDIYKFPVVDRQQFNNLFNNTYNIKTNKKKIIIKGLTILDNSIDFNAEFIPGKSTLIITNENNNKLKFISAFLNSKIMLFYIKQKYSSSSYNGGINFTKDMINNLPLKKSYISIQTDIISIVDSQLLSYDEENQNKLNKLFYKLYNLTPEEIKVVEGVND